MQTSSVVIRRFLEASLYLVQWIVPFCGLLSFQHSQLFLGQCYSKGSASAIHFLLLTLWLWGLITCYPFCLLSITLDNVTDSLDHLVCPRLLQNRTKRLKCFKLTYYVKSQPCLYLKYHEIYIHYDSERYTCPLTFSYLKIKNEACIRHVMVVT